MLVTGRTMNLKAMVKSTITMEACTKVTIKMATSMVRAPLTGLIVQGMRVTGGRVRSRGEESTSKVMDGAMRESGKTI